MSEAAATLAPHLVTFVATLLMFVVMTATNALRKKLNTDRANKFLDRIDVVVGDAVLEAENTAVVHLKQANADGKLTADEIAVVVEQTLSKIKTHLGTAGIREAKSALGKGEEELEAYLKSKLEAKVAALRTAPKPLVTSFTSPSVHING